MLKLMVASSTASGLSFGQHHKNVMAALWFFRFWLGFGIGGNYTLSAIIISEYAKKKTRGTFIAAVFAMQGYGILASGMVAAIVSAAFKAKFHVPSYQDAGAASTVPEADYVWRIILMFGAFPGALTYYSHMQMPETARYTALVAKSGKQAASDMSRVLKVELQSEKEKVERLAAKSSNSFGLFSKQFIRQHGLHLFGTASTCFLPPTLPKNIFTEFRWVPRADTINAPEEVFQIATAQTLITLRIIMPGYWFTLITLCARTRSRPTGDTNLALGKQTPSSCPTKGKSLEEISGETKETEEQASNSAANHNLTAPV
ncbi:Low affinity inorganic phosphate transporter 1 [Asimina triloba]